MSLGDELDAEASNEDNKADAGPLWRADWDGDEGTIQTGALPDSFNPHDFTAVLNELGYEPGEIRMELTAATRWEQRSARRDAFGRRTAEWDRVWLNAYRYKAVRNALTVNLPGLYAEVAQTKPSKTKQKRGESTVVVCWADIQTGKVDELGGLKEQLERLDAKRAALDAYLERSAFDHIVIADAGDILEGFDNFPAQHRTNSLSLMDQVDVAATEFWKTIRLCARRASVDVLTIPSNHCAWRSGGKTLAGKVGDDWGLHVSKRLERQNEDAQLPVTFHRSGDWDETLQFDIRGTKLGLAHGHQANNPDQVKNWWAKMTHAGVLDCQVLVTGHFHFPSMRPSGKTPDGRSKWHIQASTLDNGSSWVRNKYGEDGDPALTVFQIGNDGFDVTSFALL